MCISDVQTYVVSADAEMRNCVRRCERARERESARERERERNERDVVSADAVNEIQ